MTPPDIAAILRNAPTQVIVDPPNEKSYDDEFLAFQYNVKSSDDNYYAYPKETWIEILDDVYPHVKLALRPAKPDVADCENWSMVASAYVMIAFHKARKQKQGAFAMASNMGVHAYNAFMDSDKRVWLWEPQRNKLIGEINDPSLEHFSETERYDTTDLWFKT